MKALINFSGGIDSAYLLYWALTNVDHEVHVHHVDFIDSSGRFHAERKACEDIRQWLKDQGLEPTSWTTNSLSLGENPGYLFDYVLMAPLTVSVAMNISGITRIWTGWAIEEEELTVMFGLNNGSWNQNYIDNVWHNGCGMCPEGKPFKGREAPIYEGPITARKAETMAKMPPELLEIAWSCHHPDMEIFPGETEVHCTPCGGCSSCLLRAGKSTEEVFDIVVGSLNSDRDVMAL